MKNKNFNEINTNEINREAWNAYQEDYMKINLLANPDYYEFYSNGRSMLDVYEPMISLMGDVKGLKLLATCCACDASQAFSWYNLGAKVTATDITPKAIEIAKKSAEIMDVLSVHFVEDIQYGGRNENNRNLIVITTAPGTQKQRQEILYDDDI